MTNMKHLLPVAIALSTIAALYAIKYAGRTSHLSISLHAASKTHSQLVFGGMIFASTILITITLFNEMLPRYNAGLLSYIVFGAIVGFLSLVALVPHVVGTWREPVHNFVAWGLAWIIPVAMVCMLTWSLTSTAWRIGICLTAINIVLIVLSLLFKKLRQWVLYFQITYLALFFSFLLVAAYL